MRVPEPIRLDPAIRDLRLVAAHDEDAWEQRQHQREEEAYRRGFIAGERSLSEQLLRMRNEMAEVQRGVLESLRQTIPQAGQQCEQALIQLALQAASRLVAGMPVSAEMIEACVRDTISQVEEATEFVIHLHPEDLALLQRVGSPLLTPTPGGDHLQFHASADVSRGGCLVHTRFGTIDAQRETKLKQMAGALGV
jgi:flagellar biosynthesis/type III secretory pathway protein FliH